MDLSGLGCNSIRHSVSVGCSDKWEADDATLPPELCLDLIESLSLESDDELDDDDEELDDDEEEADRLARVSFKGDTGVMVS